MIYGVKLRWSIILNVLYVLFLIQDWKSCSIDCHFGFSNEKAPDAAFGFPQNPAVAGVLRSMESSHYYPENSVDTARRWVSTVCSFHLEK